MKGLEVWGTFGQLSAIAMFCDLYDVKAWTGIWDQSNVLEPDIENLNIRPVSRPDAVEPTKNALLL